MIECGACGDTEGPLIAITLEDPEQRAALYCEPCEQMFILDVAEGVRLSQGPDAAYDGIERWIAMRDARESPPYNMLDWPGRR